jgi:hypothetical protein
LAPKTVDHSPRQGAGPTEPGGRATVASGADRGKSAGSATCPTPDELATRTTEVLAGDDARSGGR